MKAKLILATAAVVCAAIFSSILSGGASIAEDGGKKVDSIYSCFTKLGSGLVL